MTEIQKTQGSKTYTAKDVLLEAQKAMRRELESMQGRPLTKKENDQLDRVAQSLTVDTLKNMGIKV